MSARGEAKDENESKRREREVRGETRTLSTIIEHWELR